MTRYLIVGGIYLLCLILAWLFVAGAHDGDDGQGLF